MAISTPNTNSPASDNKPNSPESAFPRSAPQGTANLKSSASSTAALPSSSSPAASEASSASSSPDSGSNTADTLGAAANAAADRDMMRRVVQGAHEAVDRIADKAIPAVERMKGSVNDATEMLHQRADQIGELKDEWTESLRTAVRQHPIAALVTALTVGAILSRITSDR